MEIIELREEEEEYIRIKGIKVRWKSIMCDEEILRLKKGKKSKEKNIEKFIVKMEKRGEKRIFWNKIRKKNIGVRIGKIEEMRIKRRRVGSIEVEKKSIEWFKNKVRGIDKKRIIFDIMGEEIIGKVMLGSSEMLGEDGRKVKIKGDVKKKIIEDNEEM